MSTTAPEEINVLELTLHDQLVGYLAGFKNGRNLLTIADEFKGNPQRPTFSLITHPKFPNSTKVMAEPWARSQRLHPSL